MVQVRACLVDTNILLRLFRETDPEYGAVQSALEALNSQGSEFYFSLQNIAEFWNVCTRPKERNGFGLSLSQTEERVAVIEGTMTLLPENDSVYGLWRRLVSAQEVRGVQVHDARLAALMMAYEVRHILTLNPTDFVRYTGIEAIQPSQMQP